MNPLHSEYCNCECPAGNSYAKLEETLNRVRMLHVKHARGNEEYCGTCAYPAIWDEWQSWPCATIRALQGDDDV